MGKTRNVLRLLSIVMCVCVILSMAACSKSNEPENSNVTSGIAEAQLTEAVEPEPEDEDGPLTKYEQQVDVTIGQTNYEGGAFIEGESVDNNVHHRFNREYLNISYTNKWIVDQSKAGEKLNLAIASDDLPDVMKVSIVQLQSLIKNGQVEDLTKVWAKYPTDTVRSFMEYQDRVAFIPSTKDEKIYGIPLARDFGETIGIMYIRQDWLDRLKLEPPGTMEELEAVAKAFVELDPDGNSKKDTYAIALDQDLGLSSGQPMLTSIAAGFGAYPKKWLKSSSGDMEYGSIQAKMKDTLAFMQKLYGLGAFDPEFAVKDLGKVTETITNGRIGIYFGVFSAPIYPLMYNKENNPDAQWAVCPIPGADGKAAPAANLFANEWMVVRKGFKNPEAAIKSMNLWAEMFVPPSEYNKKWEEVSAGEYSGKSINLYALPYNFDSPFQNLQNGANLRKALETGDESTLNPREKWILSERNKGGAYGWAIEKTFYEAEKILMEYENIRYSDFQGAPTPAMISRGPSLDNLELETYIKIIMGNPVDEFDKFADQWKALGGAEIAKEINESVK